MNDPIVDEVRRVRDAHAAMFNYDLDEIFRDIKEQEKLSGLKFVSYPPRKTETLRQTGTTHALSPDSTSPEAVSIQVFELTMDNPEDQDDLNRQLQ